MTLLARVRRHQTACLKKWWPDQAIGGLVAVCSIVAVLTGDQAFSGVGLSEMIGTWGIRLWFTTLAVAGVSLIITTEFDRPKAIGCSLIIVALLMGANGVLTVIAKDAGAIGALIAYTGFAMLLIKRAQDIGKAQIGSDLADHLIERFDQVAASRIED